MMGIQHGPTQVQGFKAPPRPVAKAPTPQPVAYQPPVMPAPPTAVGATGRANAEEAWQGAQTGNRDAIFRAAMNLGDQSVLDQLKADPNYAGYQFSVDPNSAFSQIGRQEQEGLQGIDQASNSNNAFFSGFRLQDRNKLSDESQRQRGAATTGYLDALKGYASALAEARRQHDMDVAGANQQDIDAAAALEPVAGPAPEPISKGVARPVKAAKKPKKKKKG